MSSDSFSYSVFLHFYSYGFVTYSVTNPQPTSDQTIPRTHSEFCLHSGTNNRTTDHETNMGYITPDFLLTLLGRQLSTWKSAELAMTSPLGEVVYTSIRALGAMVASTGKVN